MISFKNRNKSLFSPFVLVIAMGLVFPTEFLILFSECFPLKLLIVKIDMPYTVNVHLRYIEWKRNNYFKFEATNIYVCIYLQ